jgi:hypothetical protein
MIEVYLFLAAFTAQILGMSVLVPSRFARLIRTGWKNIPAERLAELYPGVDVGQAHERFLDRYRAVNTVVAGLGLLLLGWFMSYMQRPNWDLGAVSGMGTAYVMLQNFPFILLAWFTHRFNKVHRRLLREPKRKAVLQRRGLFDFISPSTVLLAILAYLQYAAVIFYAARHPFPGFGGAFANIGTVSLMYILLGAIVVKLHYRKKKDPLQTNADRIRMVRGVANFYAWVCILMSVLLSFSMLQKLLKLETWGPFAGTVYFLIITLLLLHGFSAPPRQPEGDGLGSSPVR